MLIVKRASAIKAMAAGVTFDPACRLPSSGRELLFHDDSGPEVSAEKMWSLPMKTRLIFFCGIAFFLWLRPITIQGAYDSIDIGMTKEQVQRIMGVAPGEYYSSAECRPFSWQPVSKSVPQTKEAKEERANELIWYFDECGIEVYLENGRVIRKWQHRTNCPEDVQTLAHKLRNSFWWILR